MRFLIWLVALFWTVVMLRRAVTWIFRAMLGSPEHRNVPVDAKTATGSRRLVRDPVCGVHVAENRAIPLRVGSEIVHFCSAACRDRFAAVEQKLAAHG